ncbi:Aldehyde reductase, partial [Phytophthora megakarya]
MTPTMAIKILPSRAAMPVIGLGVFRSEPGAETYNAVLSALKLGYRHIHTAQYYENEADVGCTVRDSGIAREEIFVATKSFLDSWSYNEAMNAAKSSNEKLGLGYTD